MSSKVSRNERRCPTKLADGPSAPRALVAKGDRLTAMLRAPIFRRARNVARDWANNHVERPVARALKVGRTLGRNDGHGLYLGESSLLHISPHDSDRRRLGEMLSAALPFDLAQFYGPGYSPALLAELVRLVGAGPKPRCVVMPLTIRTMGPLHVVEHPVYGYKRSIEILRAADAIDLRLARKVYKPKPTETDYARFEALEVTTRWGLAATIGDYRRGLRGYDLHGAPEDQQRLLYDYFHGEFIGGNPGLHHWERLGENLKRLDVPVLAYRTYMPIEYGTRLLGDDFADHVERNFQAVEERFFEGLGHQEYIEVGPLPDSYFGTVLDATEHLNETGRKHVADTLLRALVARTT